MVPKWIEQELSKPALLYRHHRTTQRHGGLHSFMDQTESRLPTPRLTRPDSTCSTYLDADKERNLQLLKVRGWFDILGRQQ
jgi:hypothetical protein